VLVAAIVVVIVLASGGGKKQAVGSSSSTPASPPQAAANTGPGSSPPVGNIPSKDLSGGMTLRGPIALSSGGMPAGVVVVGRDAWVADSTHGLLVNIHEDGSQYRVRVGSEPVRVAFDREGGRLWVANEGSNDVTELDRFGKVLDTIKVGPKPVAVAAGLRAAWVANSGNGTVTRVDYADPSNTKSIPVGPNPTDVVTAFSRVWVARSDGTIVVLDPDGSMNGTVNLPGPGTPIDMAASNGLWVVRAAGSGGTGRLSRVDPRITAAVRQIPPYQYAVHGDSPEVGSDPVGIDALGVRLADNTIWVLARSDHTLRRIGTLEPNNDKVLFQVSVGQSPEAIGVYTSVVWVADAGEKAVYELTYGG
jgi:DNA-binding beta-propeller fold protein YncE